MYITAHRVRATDGRTGVNSFLYLHGDAAIPGMSWEAPKAGRVADQFPGSLSESVSEIKPGGNSVLSYLDIAAPDSTESEAIEQALDEFAIDLQRSSGPLEKALGHVAIRFGCAFGLFGIEYEEFLRLRQHALEVLKKHPPTITAAH